MIQTTIKSSSRNQESIDANADGNVTFWEFARAVADGPAAHTLQNFVTRFRGLAVNKFEETTILDVGLDVADVP